MNLAEPNYFYSRERRIEPMWNKLYQITVVRSDPIKIIFFPNREDGDHANQIKSNLSRFSRSDNQIKRQGLFSCDSHLHRKFGVMISNGALL